MTTMPKATFQFPSFSGRARANDSVAPTRGTTIAATAHFEDPGFPALSWRSAE